jgi:hypothetical protein
LVLEILFFVFIVDINTIVLVKAVSAITYSKC